MIRCLRHMPAGVLGLEAVDDVEKEDYENVILPAVEAAIAEHGKVRLVYVLGPEFDDYEGEAVWEDLKLGGRHPTSFERVAIVTNARWAGPAVKMFSVLCARTGACVPALRARGGEALGGRRRRLTPTGWSSPPGARVQSAQITATSMAMMVSRPQRVVRHEEELGERRQRGQEDAGEERPGLSRDDGDADRHGERADDEVEPAPHA